MKKTIDYYVRELNQLYKSSYRLKLINKKELLEGLIYANKLKTKEINIEILKKINNRKNYLNSKYFKNYEYQYISLLQSYWWL